MLWIRNARGGQQEDTFDPTAGVGGYGSTVAPSMLAAANTQRQAFPLQLQHCAGGGTGGATGVAAGTSAGMQVKTSASLSLSLARAHPLQLSQVDFAQSSGGV